RRVYRATSSYGQFPALSYLPRLIELATASGYANDVAKAKADNMLLDFARGNFLRVSIFAEHLKVYRVEDSPSYELKDLLSDCGGQGGFWLGLSILTMFELADLLSQLMRSCCRGLGERNERHQNNRAQLHQAMTDYSLKGFLQNGGQFPHQQRSRRRSNTGGSGVQRELERHSAAVEDGAAGKGRRMSLGSLSASRLSMASSIGSYNGSTIQQLEQAGDLSHQGDDTRTAASFHYNREEQLLTLKIIEQGSSLSQRSEICAFATVSFCRPSSSAPLGDQSPNADQPATSSTRRSLSRCGTGPPGTSSTLIGEAVILLRRPDPGGAGERSSCCGNSSGLDRQESELPLQGELVFCCAARCKRKKRLTVNNAAIPVSATTPCLYMKLMLLRGHNVVLSDRTAAVTNSYNPVFNHKMRISLQSSSLERRQPEAAAQAGAHGPHGESSASSAVQHYFQKTVGVIHLGADSEREDLREAWKQILSCKDKKLSFRLKFSTPRRSSTDN
uniref:C2 domain-containing protein n=1 Tax=Macrostomum lignano TaxID=282301 RepID=A0A1I8F276_9PLAT